MNPRNDDQNVIERFHQLRQADQGTAPTFSSVLNNARHRKPRDFRFQSVAGFALVVLTVAFFISWIPNSENTYGPDGSGSGPAFTASSLAIVSVDEMPTDFLLETPWSVMASLDTGVQLLDLSNEFLENLPNEP